MTETVALELIKKNLCISDSSKDLLITDIITNILNYCNLKELPRVLEPFVRKKVKSVINYEENNDVIEGLELKSIKLGDASVSVESNVSKNELYGLSEDDKKYLRMFRRLRR